MTVELMNQPPLGFFFIVKNAVLEGIPTMFFALQKDGTEDTISFQVPSLEVGLSIDNLNKVLDTLIAEWDKEHGTGAAPDVNSYINYTTGASVPAKATKGEFV